MLMKNQMIVKQNQESKLTIVTLCLGLYFMMMPFDSFSMFGIGSLLRIAVLLPVGAIVFLKLRSSIHLNSLTISFVLYCASLVLSCIYSIVPSVSTGSVKRVILNMVVMICVGGMYDYNYREIEFLKKSLVGGSLATLGLTLLFADYSSSGRLTLNVNGDTQDQNYLNGYIFFAYVYFFSKAVKEKKPLMYLPVGGMLFFTLMTGSRGALVALAGISAVCGFCVLLQEKRMKLSTFIIIGVVGLLLAILYEPVLTLLPEEVGQRFSIQYIIQNGNTGRSDIWRYLLRRYASSSLFRMLFGYGYGTVVLVNEFNHLVAHNLWIDHLIMGGIVGELFFVGMQIVYLRSAWKSKDIFSIGNYCGYLIMMLTLSLLSYKPIWNCMMMIMIITRYQQQHPQDDAVSTNEGQK